MNASMIRPILITLLLSTPLILAGCLMSEEDEYNVKLNPDGKSGSITVIKYNVQSDQTEKAKQKDDFDELVKDWKSDSYLLDKTKEGVYVKNRELWTKNGKLIWKEVSIFSDFSRLFRNELVNDTLRLTFEKEQTIVATNGVVERTADKTTVTWPPKTTEYKLRIRQNNFAAKTDFATEFRKLFKK